MPYDDLNNTLNPAAGVAATAAWGDQIRENFENGEYTIARTILGGAASSISSGTLPTLSNSWCLKIFCRVQNSGGAGVGFGIRFNGDSGANYSRQLISSVDTTATALESTGDTQFTFQTHSNSSANRWAVAQLTVMDYLGSGHKSIMSHGYDPQALTTQQMYVGGGLWASTAAITSVSIHAVSNNFVTGSSLTVVACNYV